MKNIFITLSLILMLSLVFATQDSLSGQNSDLEDIDISVNVGQNGDVDVISSGEGEEIRVQTGANGQLVVSQNGQQVVVGANGEQIMVRQGENNQIRLEVGGKSAESSLKINQESVDGKSKLSVQLSNGKNAEIKVMPDAASEVALERLRLRVCSEENGCSIELKEVGTGDDAGLAYEVKTQRQSKVLGLFGATMQVQAQVNAENGELMNVDKPWWAFLASEPEE